jgi:hypothetical protein
MQQEEHNQNALNQADDRHNENHEQNASGNSLILILWHHLILPVFAVGMMLYLLHKGK